MNTRATAGPQMWGGIECTVNRVGDSWFNQLTRTGHAYREDDLDRIAALGIKTLRFPILWELHQPSLGVPIDWQATDRRLARLRELGITPIAGLVHHGSGPAHTDLMSEGFAPGLASFARLVATRHPSLEWYTPVNEPLTTARFSGLYGLWYPHARSDSAFTRALINQCRAIVLSMREIRRINPHAKLLQTEDLGKTYSTPHMKYQARFENQRRWLTWDLLCGRVDLRHPLRTYLLRTGISVEELEWFQDNRCAPDMIGINHYVTSDRFLDEQVQKYPPACHGGNARESYADVEAVRVLKRPRASWHRVIRESARRYHLPLALTEVHIGCTREEQLRWLNEAWNAAARADARGFNVRAVSAWALFGSVDWNTLLTRGTEHYEPGAFDVSAGTPRETAIGKMIRALSSGRAAPLEAGGSGWWQRKDRLLYPYDKANDKKAQDTTRGRHAPAFRTLLITGGEGRLGSACAAACESRGLAFTRLPHAELDITNRYAVASALVEHSPWAVVNAAAADPKELLAFLSQAGLPVLNFAAPPVSGTGFGALTIRLGQCFGPPFEGGSLLELLKQVSEGRAYDAPADGSQAWSYIPDVMHAALNLLIDGESGVWHLANTGSASQADLIARCAALLCFGAERLLTEPLPSEPLLQGAQAWPTAARHERALPLPTLESAIQRFVASLRPRFEISNQSTRRTA